MGAPCDFCVFKNKRLRSKTPPPAESRYRGRRKRLRSKSVDPVCKEKMSTEVSEEQRKDQARVHEKSKCYRVTWAWKLSDMGFSDEQIEAAISECSTSVRRSNGSALIEMVCFLIHYSADAVIA